MLRSSFVLRCWNHKHTLNELRRVTRLHYQISSETLKLRVEELVSSLKLNESSQLDYHEVSNLNEVALRFWGELKDRNSQLALHHVRRTLQEGGWYGDVLVPRLAISCCYAKQSPYRLAIIDLVLHYIRCSSKQELLSLVKAFRRGNMTDQVLWSEMIVQLQGFFSELTISELSNVLSALGNCGYNAKEFIDECEKVILALPQVDKRILQSAVLTFRKLSRSCSSVQARLVEFELKKTDLNSLAVMKNIEVPKLDLPDRKTFAKQEEEKKLNETLTLSQKEALNEKVLSVMPHLSLPDLVSIIASTRRKGAETAAQLMLACDVINKSPANTFETELINDVSLVLIKSPFMAVPEVSYKVEDLLNELYSLEHVSILSPESDPKGALRQISILTDAVSTLPRLSATKLIRSLVSHVSSLGNQYEKISEDVGPRALRDSLPAYAYYTVRLLTSCKSYDVLDVNRRGIALGLHGLSPAKAASLAMTVATLKSPISNSNTPLNIYLLDAIVDVLLERGITTLTPSLAISMIDAFYITKVRRVHLLQMLVDIVVNSARSTLSSTSKYNFDAFRSVSAMRRAVSLISDEKVAAIFSHVKPGAVDTLSIALKRSSGGVELLAEGLSLMALLITCDASLAAAADRRNKSLKKNQVFRVMDNRNTFPSLAILSRITPSASVNDTRMVTELLRRLRTTVRHASASETVSILSSLSLLREVPQLENELLIKELPILAVKQASAVLGSAAPAVISSLLTSTASMELPSDVSEGFRKVCAKALMDGLEKDAAKVKGWCFEKTCAYSKAAHAVCTFSQENYLSQRFGVVLWRASKSFLDALSSGSIPDSAAFCAVVSQAFKSGVLFLEEAERQALIDLAVSGGNNLGSSATSVASFVVSLINLGVLPTTEHPLYSVVRKRRVDILYVAEAVALLTRQGVSEWLLVDASLSKTELNAISKAVSEGMSGNRAEILEDEEPLDVNSLFKEYNSNQEETAPVFVNLPEFKISLKSSKTSNNKQQISGAKKTSKQKNIKAVRYSVKNSSKQRKQESRLPTKTKITHTMPQKGQQKSHQRNKKGDASIKK